MSARLPRSLVAAFVAIVATSGRSAPPPAPDPAAALQAWLDGIRDLRGRFEQRLVSGALGESAAETGTFIVKRPGRMRWDYRSPEKKIAGLDGDRTWVWIEDEKRLLRGRLDVAGSPLPALLSGQARLIDRFDVRVELERETPKFVPVRLAPKGGSVGAESLILWVSMPEGAVEGGEVLDDSGNRVEYRFYGVKRNRGVADDEFQFAVPPGAQIVEEP